MSFRWKKYKLKTKYMCKYIIYLIKVYLQWNLYFKWVTTNYNNFEF